MLCVCTGQAAPSQHLWALLTSRLAARAEAEGSAVGRPQAHAAAVLVKEGQVAAGGEGAGQAWGSCWLSIFVLILPLPSFGKQGELVETVRRVRCAAAHTTPTQQASCKARRCAHRSRNSSVGLNGRHCVTPPNQPSSEAGSSPLVASYTIHR